MITTAAVAGYRSLRDVVVGLGPLTVITGANGTGKTSLYRALRLLADCGAGRVVGSLAREGGLPSALWAGPETLSGTRRRGAAVEGAVRRGPVSLRLGYGVDEGFGYVVDLGLPVGAMGEPGRPAAFDLDPVIKREVVFAGGVARPGAVLVARDGPSVRSRDAGGWVQLAGGLEAWDSALTALADPRRAPELLAVREQIRGWRFYDAFRTDPDAPPRRPQVGTLTPVLGGDGSDLAAALQTIREIGDSAALDGSVADAFDGARVEIGSAAGVFDVALRQPGMLRALASAELSDGTLRYLLLVAALLTPRPPALMVLNEPETSLHPVLLEPLARLMVLAARRTQLVVVTHSRPLVDALREAGATAVELAKDLGETVVVGQGRLDGPAWTWGSR